MPEKMRASLNQFSYDVMKIRVGKATTKNLSFFSLRFHNNGYFEVEFWGNFYNAFLLNTALLIS